nr:ARMT1-like domain-containing protein [Crassaminicella thermophila]
MDHYRTAPEVGRDIHQLVKKYTKTQDPYKNLKKMSIETAEKIYPDMKHFLYRQKDRLYWALKISAVGNVMDAAIYGEKSLKENFLEQINEKFKICEIEKLKKQLENGKQLLIIGDNAGETVFDRVLVEEFLNYEIIYAVRNSPIINDATFKDAYASKLHHGAKIISTGCDAPGVVLDECSEEFKQIYNGADIIISKGQGNYETLSHEGRGIFFLLKAKCPVIARDIGVEVNDYVFIQK